MIRRNVMRGALLLCLGVLGCDAAEQEEGAAQAAAPAARTEALPRVPYRNLTKDQIIVLLDESDVDAVATRISAMAQDSHNAVVCDSLRSIWADPGGMKHRLLSPELAAAARVRVALAATLAQCDDGPEPEYYEYVHAILTGSADEMDRSSAAVALGIVGSDADVPLLLELAKDQHSGLIASQAVAGLGIMFSNAAKRALGEIAEMRSLDPHVRDLAKRYLRPDERR
jgi:HEAT repeats